MNWKPNMKTIAFVMTMLLTMVHSGVIAGQQKPTTGYAPVNGLKMYYEIHGSGEPVVMLHGAFMAISGDWNEFVGELSKTRKVVAYDFGADKLKATKAPMFFIHGDVDGVRL